MTATASRRFLQRMAMDVLQRNLSSRETQVYLDAPVEMVVPRVMGSTEAMQVWLEEELFYFLLLNNFRPRNESVEEIPLKLRRGEMTALGALGEIMLSTGFSLRNPGNDTFVTVVLEQCLGLQVQSRRVAPILEAGKKMYDGHRVRFLGSYGNSQADIIKIVLAHEDCTRFLLDRHYRRLLGNPLLGNRRRDRSSQAELWVERVRGEPGQFFDVLGEWIMSDAYREALALRRVRNDRQFIRGMYMDLLKRTPSYQELRNMRNAMQSMADPAPLRSVMAKVILDSGQASLPGLVSGREADFVTECFRAYLARNPTQEENAAFVEILRDGASARQVVRALVGSPEYQYY